MARHDLQETECRPVEPPLPDEPLAVARIGDRRMISGIFHALRTLIAT